MEKLDADRDKHKNNLKQKLAERRRKRQEALTRKQENDMAKELLEQKRELADTRSSAVRDVFAHLIYIGRQSVFYLEP